jgi:hypothetical protein
MRGEPGTVVLLSDLSMFSQYPGGFFVGVKNLHDEVLQAEDSIDIRIAWHAVVDETYAGTAHGNRNHLQDFNMIQNDDLLTIEPDSSATFFFQMDHQAAELWNLAGLRFYTSPGNPSPFSWFEAGPITLEASGTVQLFESIGALTLEPSVYTIYYTIFVGAPEPVEVESLLARYEAGTVVLTWQTPFEDPSHYGIRVEKGTTPDEFPVVYEEFIPPSTEPDTTTYYSYVDSLGIVSGTWYYRLQRWDDFGFVVWPLAPTDPVSVAVPE